MAAKKGSGRSSSSTTRKSPGRSVVAATPPQGSRRSASSSRGGSGEVRRAISGRETELAAIASFVVGVLIALAVYVELAGPVGRGADAALGAVIGLGRYLLPVVAVTIGVILIREDDAPGRTKMTLGWGGLVVAVLGIVHIGRGPDGYRGVDDLGGAGGWIGAVVGQTLRALIGPIGAVLVLVAIGLAATLLITRWSLRDLFERLRHLGSALSERLGSGLREAADDLSTLKSDRDDTTATTTPASAVHEPGFAPLVPAEPEDSSDESADDANDAEPAPVLRRRSRRESSPEPSSTSPDPTQVPVQESLDVKVTVPRGDWKLPPASSLVRTGAQSIDESEIDRRGRILEESLSSHGVDVRLVGRTVGPTVTRYELELGPGVKVARVTSLQKDIAYSLAATDVRILAPIPGRSAIGIEVPNSSRQLVALGDLMASAEAKNATHPLDVAIGKDISGRSVFLNLSTTPHLLIAGATGAGKSSGINCIITSLLMRTTPDQVKLILVDPKQVEMGQYARLPHLLTQPVNNPKKAANALAWAVREMEKRYDLLYEMGYRDITGYNAAFDRGELVAEAGTDRTFERMKYIVVVVDELNDLMMVAARDVEESITRIAQKARAVGIHLIIATQRPSVNVITGVIKANIPARMAFAVSSQMDSRVILDQVGAEKLVGRGDMLLLPGNSSVAQRIQGCWVTEDEVRKVVAHWRQQAPEVEYVKGVEGDEPSAGGSAGSAITDSYGNDDDDESLLRQAMELVVRSQLGSTSMLQRKLKVGFARAGRIMDLLEERGVVGPSTGSKAREVLMTVEELEAQA
ncbi:MAG: DNA translocase FtsK 4TM domain-containing protein [Actinomycetota bacterium]|nr:DNA translocase FtsK 4TM domain-containing protein [Actinomycetota bacterium]MDA3011473.1 DNA translocase FtsK 4TM domain-containing protein [Actinomycetota bacterium]MDA3024125.1 DNA translocase FtsK 4TM domain-containing protein [Actinomycetota bacterium]